MRLDDLAGRYADLRDELDAAYTDPVWDSSRIDRIAEQLIPVERALATFGYRYRTDENSAQTGGS